MSQTKSENDNISKAVIATSECQAIIETLKESPAAKSVTLDTLFKDWISAVVAGLRGEGGLFQTRVEDHLNHLDPSDEDVVKGTNAFLDAFAELVSQTNKLGRPMLGDLYMDLSSRSTKDALGQFFTPFHVSKLGAKMTISEEDIKEATEENPLSIADPTCGASRMQIAVAMAARERRKQVPVVVQGTDLDKVCAQMSVINLYLFQIPGRVYHANSLTNETFEAWEIQPDEKKGLIVEQIDDPEREQPTKANNNEQDSEGDDPVTLSQGELSEFLNK